MLLIFQNVPNSFPRRSVGEPLARIRSISSSILFPPHNWLARICLNSCHCLVYDPHKKTFGAYIRSTVCVVSTDLPHGLSCWQYSVWYGQIMTDSFERQPSLAQQRNITNVLRSSFRPMETRRFVYVSQCTMEKERERVGKKPVAMHHRRFVCMRIHCDVEILGLTVIIFAWRRNELCTRDLISDKTLNCIHWASIYLARI